MVETTERPFTVPQTALDLLNIRQTVKDSVFCDLFSDKKYSLKIYKTLHPEDTDVTEDDIRNVTIDNIITDQMYNDLGMTVRRTLLVLLEAQSTWTMNIIVRILLYLAHTWHRYIEETKQNRYSSKKLVLPRPEFYVIFTGNRQDRPEWIRLSEEFFDKNADFLEVNVRVLYGEEGQSDIISQYVDFTRVYNEQVKQYGRTEKAVRETIRICKDRNILKEYLESREKEVTTIMTSLFDKEEIFKQYVEQYAEQYAKQYAKQYAEQYGSEKWEEGRMEGRMDTKKETALNMKKKGYPEAAIADILEVKLNTVQQWISDPQTAMPQ